MEGLAITTKQKNYTMNNKVIKKANIEFYTKTNQASINIDCDVNFALSLHREDILWIDEEATKKKFPYLKTTTKKLLTLSDGWYVVISRSILWGNTLQIIMEEAHEKNNFKKKFAHLSINPI